MLNSLWIFPSIGAVLILATSAPSWRHRPGALWERIGIESWIALAILTAQMFFAWQARRNRRALIVAESNRGPLQTEMEVGRNQ
jgi:hypothetical protein